MIQAPMRSIFRRQFKNYIMILISGIATLIAVGILFWIIATIIYKGFPAIHWNFLTQVTAPSTDPEGGIANAILGTLMIICVGSFIALPCGLLGGIWLSEFGRSSHIGHWVRFTANVMMGIPSIVIGLFVYAILVVPMGCASGFAGSVAIAILMIPIVMRVTEDMLSLVPNTLRESALALGMTRCRTTFVILFRSAKSGLITGILLSIARVAGETAPLLFTAQCSQYWPSISSFFRSPTANITVTINEYFGNDPSPIMTERAWGAALVILIIILTTNLSLRFCFKNKTN